MVSKILAGAAGFEPTITGPKPDALPLGYTPIIINSLNYLDKNLKIMNLIIFNIRINFFYNRYNFFFSYCIITKRQ